MHTHHHQVPHGHPHAHERSRDEQEHVHGLVDDSIIRSREGVAAVSTSLAVLLVTALIQVVIFGFVHSVSLLADIIHNFGDSLTALPLAAAFLLRNKRAEKYAGYFVVLTIFVSACIEGFESLNRIAHPVAIEHLYALIFAGIVGFVGNEITAAIRLRAGKHLESPALIADGHHARADGFVSLAVVVSAVFVAAGYPIADAIIGLIITAVILRITWHSYKTIAEVRS